MGMESVYKLSVILNLVDNLSGQMNNVQSSVSGSVDKLNSAFGTMQKAGVAMAGIGGTITGLAMKTVTATFDTQNALGELSSLGVKDLKAVEDAARGYVSIYRSEYNNALQVTKGHCFKTEPDAGGNELKFYCCENTVIDAGEPVGRVLVEAEATGTYYNIAPGRITISMIHLDGVDYVTNEDDWLFEEGAEEEDLEDLRDRCMSSWAELATRTIEEKLRNAAKAVPGVLDARIDAQHPRGQGTVDVIVTGAAGEASPELIRKVGEAIEPLKGNYEDYLVKSSEVVRQDFELVIYLAEDAATDGVDAQATKLIEDMMALTRGEMNTLYRDSIIQVLSTKIDNYRKTDILQPSDDMVLEQDKVIMAGDINVTVRNVVQSARGKE